MWKSGCLAQVLHRSMENSLPAIHSLALLSPGTAVREEMVLCPREWFQGCAQNPAETICYSTGMCFHFHCSWHGEMETAMGQTQLSQLSLV